MQSHKERYEYGLRAEEIAIDFLKQKGFLIIDHRHKTPYGEIDIVAEDGDILVFVEVKARKNPKHNELITEHQIKRNCNAGNYFISKNVQYEDSDIRFDFIAIVGDKVNEHIKNAWECY